MSTREFYYAEDQSETSITTGTAFTDKASITQTFTNGVDYYLMYCAIIRNSTNTTADVKARLFNNTDSATLRAVNYEMFSATADYHPVFGMDIYTGAGASKQFSVGFAAESSGNNVKCKNAAIIAVAKNSLDAYAEVETDLSESAGSWADHTTLTFTPATSGDYLIIASAEIRDSSTGVEVWAHLLDPDGSTVYGECQRQNKDGTNWYAWSTIIKKTLAASSQTFKTQFKTQDAVGEVAHMRSCVILALRLDQFANNYYAESLSESLTTSTTYQDKTTLTATPVARDHLTFSVFNVGLANSSNVISGQLDKGGSSQWEGSFLGPGGAGRAETFASFRVESLAASSTTWKTQWKVDGGAINGRINSSVVAILDLENAGGSPITKSFGYVIG